MSPIDLALHDMKNGSRVAAVAVAAATGDGDSWPLAFRETALREYGLSEDSSGRIDRMSDMDAEIQRLLDRATAILGQPPGEREDLRAALVEFRETFGDKPVEIVVEAGRSVIRAMPG